jgi:hypothetical protein
MATQGAQQNMAQQAQQNMGAGFTGLGNIFK